MIRIKLKNNQSGFSLLELMVAVTIFAVIMMMLSFIFRSVLEGQRSAISAQDTQESMRYTMEIISKTIRQAKKSDDDCEITSGDAINKVYNIDSNFPTISSVSADSDVLYFKNKYGNCIYYFLHNNVLYKASSTPGIFAEIYPITPQAIKISDLKFTVYDDAIGAFHSLQPRVTIKMSTEMAAGKGIHKQKINLQTTISSRHYE